MNNSGSFDQNINGTQFTFCPVYTENDQTEQVTVLTVDHIFRMQKTKDAGEYEMLDKGMLPPDIQQLENKLSEILMHHENNQVQE